VKNQVSEEELVRTLGELRQIQPDQAMLYTTLRQVPVTSGSLPRLNQGRETFMSKLKFLVPLVVAAAAVAAFVVVHNPLTSNSPSGLSSANTAANISAIAKPATGNVNDAVSSFTADASQDSANVAGEPDASTYQSGADAAAANIGDSYNENNF
jgi:hypothetical protein